MTSVSKSHLWAILGSLTLRIRYWSSSWVRPDTQIYWIHSWRPLHSRKKPTSVFKRSNEDPQVNLPSISKFFNVLGIYRCNSHKTYETVCELHTAWRDWQAERQREGRANRPPHTPEEEDEDRQYAMMLVSDPLKRFQDPQVSTLYYILTPEINILRHRSPASQSHETCAFSSCCLSCSLALFKIYRIWIWH